MLGNRYFEVLEPVYHFRLEGHCPSNCWVGASRAYEPVLTGVNARPGDFFHLLIGGDFLVRDGKAVSEALFWHPKPLFEKTYGPGNNSGELFARLAEIGLVREVSSPEVKTDYSGARNLPTLEEGRRTPTYEEKSTTFMRLAEAASCVTEMARDYGFDVKFYEFHLDRQATMQVSAVYPEGRRRILELRLGENGDMFVNPVSELHDSRSFVDAVKDSEFVKTGYVYRDRLWARDARFLDDDVFLERIGETFEHISVRNVGVAPLRLVI